MAFPLAAADFWEKLRFSSRPEFVLQHNRKQSMDGAGNFRSATFAPPKWTANVGLAGGRHSRNLEQEADLHQLMGRDGTFLAYDIRRPYPLWDPDGSILGNAAVKVKTKGSSNRSLSLEDLPPHFTVTKTDMISIFYETSKYFLCEAQETVAANGIGDTAEFEVWPYLPAGLAVGNAVTLIKACGKFKIVAGSYRPASGQGNSASGVGFPMISVP